MNGKIFYLPSVIRVFIIIAIVVLSVAPFYVSAEYHDTQRLLSTTIIALALFLSTWSIQLSAATIRFMVLMYMWGIGVVFLSPLPIWSMLEFGLLFSVVLLGVTLVPNLDKLQLNYIVYTVAVIHAYYVAHNVMQYAFTIVLSGRFEPYALSNGFSNVRSYGQFLIWTVPLLIGALATNRKFSYRYILFALLMFDFAFELLTMTRAFLVAMVFTIPAVWWFTRQYWRQYLYCMLVSSSGGILISLIMLYGVPVLLGADTLYATKFSLGRDIFDSSGRLQLWMDAWQVMMNHPLFGAGPMMTALDTVTKVSAHPHNYILQLLAEWGIPFTLILLICLLLSALKWKKLIQQVPSDSVQLALPITASLTAGLVAGLFDGLLVMPVSLVYMTLVIACFVGLWRALTPNILRKRLPYVFAIAFQFPAIFVVVFVIMNWPLRTYSFLDEASKQISGNEYQLLQQRHPRFWVTGKISIVGK
jgi:putative inorganic carbon (hco3(-)) transporter